MHIKGIRCFLIAAGLCFMAGGGVRFYRLIRTHAEDYFFAPHLLLVSVSLFLAWKILKMGLQSVDLTHRGAISLIRTGSVLMGIWSYRLYLLVGTTNVREPATPINLGLAIAYVLLGGLIMGVGLKISRLTRGAAG